MLSVSARIVAVPKAVRPVRLPSRRPAFSRRSFAAMAARYEIAVKGRPASPQASGSGKLLECPFCARVLLTMDLKGVPYRLLYVDVDDWPARLVEIQREKTVPFALDLESGKWILGSDAIVDAVEAAYPEPPLGGSGVSPPAGGRLMPLLVGHLKAKTLGTAADAEAKKAELEAGLAELEAYLAASSTPFLGGESPSAADLVVAPRIPHVLYAESVLGDPLGPQDLVPSGAQGPESTFGYPNVLAYLHRFEELPAWKKIAYDPEDVVAGWRRHQRLWNAGTSKH